jgi:hypothetical protein
MSKLDKQFQNAKPFKDWVEWKEGDIALNNKIWWALIAFIAGLLLFGAILIISY